MVPIDRRPEATCELLTWYDRHRRVLPWRALPGQRSDPYAVWLSEIMLQQTTVKAVKPFFAAFLAAWPDVNALARASLDDVLRAWAGLGYYSRARNLHACARTIVDRHGGRFPADEAALRQLPGIGSYTAAAIAAIAFGIRAVVVDGNVERVMARLFAVEDPLPRAKPAVARCMDSLTPDERPGDFAQAVMDLGATICTPRNPACAICPLAAGCLARMRNAQALFPVKAPKRERPVRYGTVFFVQNHQGEVLVQTRPAKGLLGGMSELPGTDWVTTAPIPDLGASVPRLKHVFTHFTLFLDVVRSDDLGPDVPPNLTRRWVPRDRLFEEAWPTLFRNALDLALSARDQSSRSTATAAWVS